MMDDRFRSWSIRYKSIDKMITDSNRFNTVLSSLSSNQIEIVVKPWESRWKSESWLIYYNLFGLDLSSRNDDSASRSSTTKQFDETQRYVTLLWKTMVLNHWWSAIVAISATSGTPLAAVPLFLCCRCWLRPVRNGVQKRNFQPDFA